MVRIESHGTYCGLDTLLVVDSRLDTGMLVAFVDKLQIRQKGRNSINQLIQFTEKMLKVNWIMIIFGVSTFDGKQFIWPKSNRKSLKHNEVSRIKVAASC